MYNNYKGKTEYKNVYKVTTKTNNSVKYEARVTIQGIRTDIIADTAYQAAKDLDKLLVKKGLPQKNNTLKKKE